MEEQTTSQPTEQVKGSKTIWAIVISIVIIALVVGSGIYLWRQSSSKTTEQKLQQQIVLLQNQISELQKENSDLETTEQPISTTPSEVSNDIEFPVVVYGRAGLLHNTEEGLVEKKNLEEKLVNPFTDYYNEDEINLVAMYITVPQNIGEKYSIVAIFGSEKQYGTNQFGFGKREQKYGYWEPECMGPCDFSEAFKAKYPQIVE